MPLGLRRCDFCQQIIFSGNACATCAAALSTWNNIVERMERGKLSDWYEPMHFGLLDPLTHRHMMTDQRLRSTVGWQAQLILILSVQGVWPGDDDASGVSSVA